MTDPAPSPDRDAPRSRPGSSAPSRSSTPVRASTLNRLPNRAWVPTLLAGLLALSFAGALLVRAGGDVSILVHAGPPWTSADAAPGSLTVQDADEAFDGQFFYRLGVAPWTRDGQVAGVTNDLPALRNARWGYGALAYVASGTDADLVSWALLALNVAAMTAIGAIGGGMAKWSGRHAAWGLMLVLWPGFAYSLSLDTSELVASALALGGLLALRQRRRWWAVGLLSAALLTRDTTAVIPFGIAVAGAWTLLAERYRADRSPPESRRPAPRTVRGENRGTGIMWLVAGTIPLLVFGTWQLIQRARFGALPLTSSGDNNLAAPVSGLVDQLRSLGSPSGSEELFRLISIIALVALLAVAAWAWRRSIAPLSERVAWIGAVGVVLLLNAYLWSGATAFMRASTEAGLLSILLVLAARQRWADRVIALTGLGLGAMWVITAVAQLSKLG